MNRSYVLTYSVISSGILLLVLAFQWNIVDFLTPLLTLPLLGIAWLLQMLGVILSFLFVYRRRRDGVAAFVPLAVSALAILLAIFVPFTQMWLHVNFDMHKAAREQIIAKVRSGALKPNVSYDDNLIALPKSYNVSMGGEEIIVQGALKNPYVFFFTYRGILDSYSGFLWVPKGKDPRNFMDSGEAGGEIVPFGGDWYFIGHN